MGKTQRVCLRLQQKSFFISHCFATKQYKHGTMHQFISLLSSCNDLTSRLALCLDQIMPISPRKYIAYYLFPTFRALLDYMYCFAHVLKLFSNCSIYLSKYRKYYIFIYYDNISGWKWKVWPHLDRLTKSHTLCITHMQLRILSHFHTGNYLSHTYAR